MGFAGVCPVVAEGVLGAELLEVSEEPVVVSAGVHGPGDARVVDVGCSVEGRFAFVRELVVGLGVAVQQAMRGGQDLGGLQGHLDDVPVALEPGGDSRVFVQHEYVHGPVGLPILGALPAGSAELGE